MDKQGKILRPGEYAHQNIDNYAIADEENIRGGRRVVTKISDLYLIPEDKLSELVSIVYVTDTKDDYRLIDKANHENSKGWEKIDYTKSNNAVTKATAPLKVVDQDVSLTLSTSSGLSTSGGLGILLNNNSDASKNYLTVDANGLKADYTKINSYINNKITNTLGVQTNKQDALTPVGGIKIETKKATTEISIKLKGEEKYLKADSNGLYADLSSKADLDENNKVLKTQLPGFIDDTIVLQFVQESEPSGASLEDLWYNPTSKELKLYSATTDESGNAINSWVTVSPIEGTIYLFKTSSQLKYYQYDTELAGLSQIYSDIQWVDGKGTTCKKDESANEQSININLKDNDLMLEIDDTDNTLVTKSPVDWKASDGSSSFWGENLSYDTNTGTINADATVYYKQGDGIIIDNDVIKVKNTYETSTSSRDYTIKDDTASSWELDPEVALHQLTLTQPSLYIIINSEKIKSLQSVKRAALLIRNNSDTEANVHFPESTDVYTTYLTHNESYLFIPEGGTAAIDFVIQNNNIIIYCYIGLEKPTYVLKYQSSYDLSDLATVKTLGIGTNATELVSEKCKFNKSTGYDNLWSTLIYENPIVEISSTAIDNKYVFSSNSYITGVVIPSTVTTIGNSAFFNTNLSKITFEDINKITKIDNEAFYQTKITEFTLPVNKDFTTLYNHVLGDTLISEIFIPKNILTDSYARGAFYRCTKLKKVTFQGLDSDEELRTTSVIKNGVTYPKNNLTLYNTFQSSQVSEIHWVENDNQKPRITQLGDSCFVYCPITELTTPESLNTIGDFCFQGAGLQKLHITKGVNTIGKAPCYSCYNINTITVDDGNDMYISKTPYKTTDGTYTYNDPDGTYEECNAIIERNTLKLIQGSLTTGVTIDISLNIKTMTIPDGISSIAEFAFCNNIDINKLVIPSSIQTLEQYAFFRGKCSEVILNEGLVSIGNDALGGLDNLTKLTIPASTVNIDSLFLTGYMLQEISVASENTRYSSKLPVYNEVNNKYECTGTECNAIIEYNTMTLVCGTLATGVDSISNQKTNSTYTNRYEITIPEGIEILGTKAFHEYNYKKLVYSYTLPSTLKKMETNVFKRSCASHFYYYGIHYPGDGFMQCVSNCFGNDGSGNDVITAQDPFNESSTDATFKRKFHILDSFKDNDVAKKAWLDLLWKGQYQNWEIVADLTTDE